MEKGNFEQRTDLEIVPENAQAEFVRLENHAQESAQIAAGIREDASGARANANRAELLSAGSLTAGIVGGALSGPAAPIAIGLGALGALSATAFANHESAKAESSDAAARSLARDSADLFEHATQLIDVEKARKIMEDDLAGREKEV